MHITCKKLLTVPDMLKYNYNKTKVTNTVYIYSVEE